MSPIVLYPTTTAQWHALLSEAQVQRSLCLTEELESYLVFLLMRYTENAEMAQRVIAIDYLNAARERSSTNQKEALREVGDLCLIYAGLFPERAKRKRVTPSYFVDIGQGAYHSLSELELSSVGELFLNLADQFVALIEVLRSTRTLTDNPELLQEAGFLIQQIASATPEEGEKLILPGSGPLGKDKH